jgi:hypothetical protein
VKIKVFKILNTHGVKNLEHFDAWFQEGKLEEAEGWEDFFELDGLIYKQKLLKEILEELS